MQDDGPDDGGAVRPGQDLAQRAGVQRDGAGEVDPRAVAQGDRDAAGLADEVAGQAGFCSSASQAMSTGAQRSPYRSGWKLAVAGRRPRRWRRRRRTAGRSPPTGGHGLVHERLAAGRAPRRAAARSAPDGTGRRPTGVTPSACRVTKRVRTALGGGGSGRPSGTAGRLAAGRGPVRRRGERPGVRVGDWGRRRTGGTSGRKGSSDVGCAHGQGPADQDGGPDAEEQDEDDDQQPAAAARASRRGGGAAGAEQGQAAGPSVPCGSSRADCRHCGGRICSQTRAGQRERSSSTPGPVSSSSGRGPPRRREHQRRAPARRRPGRCRATSRCRWPAGSAPPPGACRR